MTSPAPAFARPERFSAAEWEARVQLAAAYRIFDHLGWTELIYNHLSLRVPGEDGQFLVNPFGLHYSEVTASNLVKVDVLLRAFPSQADKQWFTADTFRGLMRQRGIECQSPSGFAEAFYGRKLAMRL